MALLGKSCGVLRDLKDMLKTDDSDVVTIHEISGCFKEKKAAWAAEEKTLQDAIRELTRQVKEAESQTKPAMSAEEHRRTLDDLSSMQNERQRAYRKKEDEVRGAKTELAILRSEIDSLKQKKQQLEQQAKLDVPTKRWGEGEGKEVISKINVVFHGTRSKLQLYASGSHIKWDFSQPNLVQGYVTNGVTTKNFSFDPETTSAAFITQRLWALAAWAANAPA